MLINQMQEIDLIRLYIDKMLNNGYKVNALGRMQLKDSYQYQIHIASGEITLQDDYKKGKTIENLEGLKLSAEVFQIIRENPELKYELHFLCKTRIELEDNGQTLDAIVNFHNENLEQKKNLQN